MEEEKSIFLQFFGDSPLTKVLDFLITYDSFEYSLTEIAENSGVAWTTLHSFWPQLEAMQIVKLTREIGRAKLYKLNTENKMVRSLVRFDMNLSKYYAGKEVEMQKQVA